MSSKDFEDYVDIDGVEVVDPAEPPKKPRARRASSGALVPYKSNVPAVIPSLGDLEAFIRAANAAPLLSQAEETALAIRLRDHNDLQAAQQLILSHLRLVVSIARSYLGYGLPHSDLIQEGNIGLMKAIKHFDPERGVRLMTFAVHWIKAEIQDYVVKNMQQVKMATTKNQRKLFFNLRQMRKDSHALSASEAEAIARELNVKTDEVYAMEERLAGGDTPLESSGASEDEGERGFAPIDWLTREQDGPAQQMASKARDKLSGVGLHKALALLDERSRRIIEARWLNEDGEGNVAPKTLQELARELNVSAERIRQIEKKALAAMRQALADQNPFES
ncbi:MAG: RNA polymerase sigma factor RpoH [Duodenibacillus sp.]|nr:RNA polymerase sigma factor RpoH [Duodenibacillus sp.]